MSVDYKNNNNGVSNFFARHDADSQKRIQVVATMCAERDLKAMRDLLGDKISFCPEQSSRVQSR